MGNDERDVTGCDGGLDGLRRRKGGGGRGASELELMGVNNALSLDLGAAGLYRTVGKSKRTRSLQPHGPPEAQPELTSRSDVPWLLFAVGQATNTLRRIPPIHLPPGAVLQREAYFRIKGFSGGVLWSHDEEPPIC